MNLPTITMDREKAQEAFDQYRGSLLRRHNEEDAAIARGYKALARGTPLLKLSEALKRGGLDQDSLPRLAICRADAKWCWLRLDADGEAWFSMDPRFNDYATRRYVHVPEGTFENVRTATSRWNPVRALVPIVPPPLRPRAALSNYHVLWEAEWQRTAPRDPALLRKLGGDLWAVVAVWDLTELERAVLSGREG
jgi:hypothetical protein